MITLSRLYKDYDTGSRVVTELERSGIPESDISIVSNNESGWFDRDRSNRIDRDADGVDDRAEGAGKGVGMGAVLGGAAGLLAGLGLLAIPGIGPVVAAGWLASTAAMAVAGGATGGLIGALTQSGLTEHEARGYAEGVRRGGTLVTVRVDESRRAAVEPILARFNPIDTDGFRDTGNTEDRIVVVFENTARATEARQALVGAGIDNLRMELLDNRGDLVNWGAFKRHSVPEDDTHLYTEGLRRGHAMLVMKVPPGEHDRVMQVLARFNPLDIDEHAEQWRKTGWSGVHAGKAARSGTQEEVIPVYEEELKVGKRVVEQGHVRVRVYTVERPVQEGVTLREERVAVERRPVDRPTSGAGEAFRERTIDVTTHREEPVLAKEARVKEEIVVRKEADQRTETVQDTVRRSEVEVENDRTTASSSGTPSASKR